MKPETHICLVKYKSFAGTISQIFLLKITYGRLPQLQSKDPEQSVYN